MAHSPDYYSVLGVHPTADRAVIHSRWKALLRRYHPDANPGVDVSARAKEINEAYAVLGKTEARAAYDRSRLPPSSSSPPAAHRSVYAAPGGGRPIRHGPSMRPSDSFSQPLEASQWLMGLLLLLLSAAPLGMILVLHYEETGSTYAVRRAAAVHRGPELPAEPARTSSGTRLLPRRPAS
jgi:curved DNA-binding protein CbpA